MRIAFVITLLSAWGTAEAAPRPHRHRSFCAPVYIEGAGTVLLCPPARGR